MNSSVESIRDRLMAAGVAGVESYCAKLKANSVASHHFRCIQSEAYCALIMTEAGFEVTMRESPDLELRLSGALLGAEVKCFRRKGQDDLDEVRFSSTDELIVYGDTVPTEGVSAWEQVVAVALNKSKKVLSGKPNILVIETASPHCIEAPEIITAANAISDANLEKPDLPSALLNGILLFSSEFYIGPKRSVFFVEIRGVKSALPAEMAELLGSVSEWRPG